MWSRFVPLLTLLAIAAIGCRNTSPEQGVPASAAPTAPALSSAPLVATAYGPDAAVPAVFEASGVAAAIRTSRLAAKGTGIVRSIKVREGERVKAGQVLCVLDATQSALRAEAAVADQAQSIAALGDAKSDLERSEQLYDAGTLPDQSIEKARLAARIAELRSRAAAVGVRMSQQSLADATLRAPFDGVITKVLSEEGQYVTTMPPSPVFVLVDTAVLEVRVSIPERKLTAIKKGIAVEVVLPAVNETRAAKVDRIAEVVDSVTRSVEAIIQIDNRDRALPAGLFARVRFPTVPSDEGDGATSAPSPQPSSARDETRR
jgi:RND family efflux transporter MFP subunit